MWPAHTPSTCHTPPPIYGALESMAWELGLLALPEPENDS
jgi:hypothetical protein